MTIQNNGCQFFKKKPLPIGKWNAYALKYNAFLAPVTQMLEKDQEPLAWKLGWNKTLQILEKEDFQAFQYRILGKANLNPPQDHIPYPR